MFESKYSKVLTVILVIVIIAIVGLLGFLGYNMYQKANLKKDAENFVDTFDNDVAKNDDSQEEEEGEDILEELAKTTSTSTTQGTRPTYQGFGVLGTLKIPAINISYPILDKPTKTAMEKSIVFSWGAGVNEVGNSVISGHNYRSDVFFSKNKNLKLGDKIIITDLTGRTLTYTIYNKFQTTDTDTSFYTRDTNGKPEVSLSTCTDDMKSRLIILGRVEE